MFWNNFGFYSHLGSSGAVQLNWLPIVAVRLLLFVDDCRFLFDDWDSPWWLRLSKPPFSGVRVPHPSVPRWMRFAPVAEALETTILTYFPIQNIFLTPIYVFVSAWYIIYCRVLPKDISSFGGTNWGLHFCKETNTICKNALFLDFLAYLHFVAW